MAHHTNYALPPDGVLYANDWMANRTYVFNLHDPLHPSLQRQFGNAVPYGWPHSFVHLSNGNTLATFQYADGFNRAPGGLVEFNPSGDVVTTSSAAVPVLAGSCAYVVAEASKWRSASLNLKPGLAAKFYIVIGVSIVVGLAFDFSGISAVKMLFWSAILNGLLAPLPSGRFQLADSPSSDVERVDARRQQNLHPTSSEQARRDL